VLELHVAIVPREDVLCVKEAIAPAAYRLALPGLEDPKVLLLLDLLGCRVPKVRAADRAGGVVAAVGTVEPADDAPGVVPVAALGGDERVLRGALGLLAIADRTNRVLVVCRGTCFRCRESVGHVGVDVQGAAVAKTDEGGRGRSPKEEVVEGVGGQRAVRAGTPPGDPAWRSGCCC
jgi:hypothetical protein